MFDKLTFMIRKNHEKTLKELSDAIKKHDDVLKTISEAEIESKDRVDISLSEYERLKRENADLREKYELVIHTIE